MARVYVLLSATKYAVGIDADFHVTLLCAPPTEPDVGVWHDVGFNYRRMDGWMMMMDIWGKRLLQHQSRKYPGDIDTFVACGRLILLKRD